MNKNFPGIKILRKLLQTPDSGRVPGARQAGRGKESAFQSGLHERACREPMISKKKDLQALAAEARDAGAVGIDTEFVWNRTFYPTLGLVQVGFPDGRCTLIDAPGVEDWSPLGELLAYESTTKILHDAQQDLKILRRTCNANPRNIFDTQLSCGFIGLPSTISLSDALKKLLRVRLAKTETQSDWVARPLTEAQLKYAEEDVRHSVDLMLEIMKQAEELGRSEWIREEMSLYDDPRLYEELNPEAEMPRVRGSGALTKRQRDVLRALAAWRESAARKRNLPRSFILSDEAIVALTKKTPATAEAIHPVKGLSKNNLDRNRERIWKAIQRGIDGDLPDLPNGNHKGPPPDDGFESRVDLALACIKGTCLAASIDPPLVGNRAEITAFVLEAAEPAGGDSRLRQGWRAEFCGDRLQALLLGRGSVVIDSRTNMP
ncbi:MAG: ribonuclease D, partial [Coraliomargarita sp.]